MNQDIQKIDRFEVIRILGKGAQSVVYLAYDPKLQREVAIKTLHFAEQKDRQNELQALIQESRTVSKMRHPNLVPIFEAGEYDDDPYLVFEYVEGQTLADLLRKKGKLPANEAIGIIGPVLEAVAHAHLNGVIHRDLKPSNILISPEGIPRVMDFGIAERISDKPGELNEALMGTPAYMAPEYIDGRTVSEKNDIFAAGLILYEMVVGHKAVQGTNIYQIMHRIASEPIDLPPSSEVTIDEKLGNIILKALEKDPLDRYASAQEMRDALHTYMLANEEAPSSESKQSTLEFLLRRMRHRGDFPALSESVSSINRVVSSDRESVNKLSNSILKDFALTNKILRLVNTAFYSSYGGGTISTISRAVIILGFDAVRNIAVTLILFEHMQNKAHATNLKEEFIQTLFSGLLAKDIAKGAAKDVKDPEEAFICSMFHNLGRLLAMFYFQEEAETINRVMAQKECSEDIASAQVLGISYQDLGIGIAKTWGFPEQIVHSMRKLPPDSVPRPKNSMDKLRIISSFSNELCEIVANTPIENRLKAIRKLSGRYGDSMPIQEKQLQQALEKTLDEITQFAGTVRLGIKQSQIGKQATIWTKQTHQEGTIKGSVSEQAADVAALATAESQMQDTIVITATAGVTLAQAKLPENMENKQGAGNAQAILTSCIQDISNSLVDGCSLNDILRMILETMYRSMGFQRVLLCIKDAKQNAMVGRFGFGEDINQTIKNFKFPLSYTPDVFHAALSKGVDILISDINDPKIRERIPDWYRKAITAQTFVLFPLNIKSAPVALIYADKETAGDINMPENELSLLRTLRNQAVLAIKQTL